MNTGSLLPQEIRRYHRQMMLHDIGPEGQEALKKAKVLVVGAGGLGCPALQYLAAAGVGKLGIIDFDKVNEENLQRQVLYGLNDLGKLKAIIAKTRLHQQNPHVEYEIINIRLDSSNAEEIISQYDVVVDATDNFPTRYLISDACVLLKKPMVYGSIFKYEGQVSVFNYNDGPTYRCLYPLMPGKNEAPSPADVGVIGVLPGIIGTFQANEVLKIIIGNGNILSGKLLVVNIQDPSTYVVKIKKNPKNLSITTLGDLPS
jgi:adenylyltransferase/sulfurtransferase